MLLQRTIPWKRAVRRIPWTEFHQVSATGASFGAGAAVAAQISTFTVGGMVIGAAADEWGVIDMQTPLLFDPREELGLRVLWAQIATGEEADDLKFIVTYDQVDAGEALAAPSTALDTLIAQQTNVGGTTLLYHQTSRGIIDADTFDMKARQGIFLWKVEADVSGFADNEAVFLGLEIDYMPLPIEGEGLPEDELTDRDAI